MLATCTLLDWRRPPPSINDRVHPECRPSAAMMLFGQRMKLHGGLCNHGGEARPSADADDPSSLVVRRLKIRVAAQLALERYHAKDVVRRSAAARTRTVQGVAVGQSVFFYRDYATTAAQRAQAAWRCYLGPKL